MKLTICSNSPVALKISFLEPQPICAWNWCNPWLKASKKCFVKPSFEESIGYFGPIGYSFRQYARLFLSSLVFVGLDGDTLPAFEPKPAAPGVPKESLHPSADLAQ